MKILIFVFGGSSNQNYMGYMLDLYALLEFECSPDLKEALLNNFLMNLKGEVGKWIEGDLLQEHYNRWLEDMIRRRGGEFDDQFYRKTIAPNVQHFLDIKEDISDAFELKRRSKSHTSPHLRDETNTLLCMYKEEELHLFRSGRSMGHAAVNRFDRGYQRLEGGKLAEYLERSAIYADMLTDMEKIRNNSGDPQNMDLDPDNPAPSPEPKSSSPSSQNFNSASTSPRPSSASSTRSSMRSTCSSAARSAADAVEDWDLVDHSDERLVSGSDLAVTVDSVTGRMSDDWYEEDEFEEVLARLCGVEEEVEDSEDDEILSDSESAESGGDDEDEDEQE